MTENDVEIEAFLNGSNPKKHVVKIEPYYHKDYAEVIIQDPKTNKKTIEEIQFKPFMFIKDLQKNGIKLYSDAKSKAAAMKKHDIKVIKLRTCDDNGKDLERLTNGYTYLITTNDYNSSNNLTNFFKNGGVDINAMYSKVRGLETSVKYKKEVITKNLAKIELIKKKNKYQKLIERIEFLKTKPLLITRAELKEMEEEEKILEAKRNGIEVVENETNFLDDLEGFVDGEIIEAIPPTKPVKVRKVRAKKVKEENPEDNDLDLLQSKVLKIEEEIQKIIDKNNLAIADLEGLNKEFLSSKEKQECFMSLNILDQFMIYTGIRMFKGFDLYSDIHKMVFDIETTGLEPLEHRVFLIGMKDNKGFFKLLAVDKENDDESEKNIILEFFATYVRLHPAIFFGYYSENFDWNFILTRAQILGINLENIRTTPKATKNIERKEASLKLGGETEFYLQTNIYGINIIDIIHSVRRAKAINSDIKEAGLKYITKFSKLNKANRMYIKGDTIYKYWFENKLFLINKENNKYIEFPEDLQNDAKNHKEKTITDYKYSDVYKEFLANNSEKKEIITGKDIVRQYLIDDLEETEAVDNEFNEASFSLSKLLPSGFVKISTAGGASLWNLLMTSWSYDNKLAIPNKAKPREFTGGLSRTFELGFTEKIQKADFAGLYPSIQLEWDVFPKHDVTHVLRRFLNFFLNSRNVYKKLAKELKDSDPQKSKFYSTKEKPMKIFNNTNFGALSSVYFNWGDIDCGEEITCRGRQYLRLMLDFFINKGAKPIVLDTDGVSLSIPSEVSKESLAEWFQDLNKNVLNAKYMKIDDDGEWQSCICVARKNYANLEYDGKIKLVGNSIKSSTLPEYIEIFFNKAMVLLLVGKGKEFIEYYYEYLNKIFFKEIPLKQIASKKKIKKSVEDYKKRGKDKNGADKAKQAHMELIIKQDIKVNLGDVVYIVNNGKAKSHGDSGMSKEGVPYSYLIKAKDLDENPDMTGDYNVARAVSRFNTAIETILIVFKPEVKDTLLKKDPEKREFYEEETMNLTSYNFDTYPDEDKDEKIDSLTKAGRNPALFTMEAKEVKFWNNSGMNPYEIFENFTPEKPLAYDKEYYMKLNKVQKKLKSIGHKMRVKTPNQELNIDDMVLMQEENKYMVKIVDQDGVLSDWQEVL